MKTGVYRIAGATELTTGKVEFSHDLDDEIPGFASAPPRRPAREEFSQLAEELKGGGFSSGPRRAAPREESSKDLDDEIPF